MDSSYPSHHFIKAGYIKTCQVCNSGALLEVLDLGLQPLCDTLLAKEDLSKPETKYPLSLYWCPECSLAQINYCVDSGVLYHPNYPYRTGATKELVEYMAGLAGSLASDYKLGSGDLVVDLGSNDGTLLNEFKKLGIKVLGVEPTDVAKIANKNGIDTVQSFFDIKTASEIKNRYGKASLITATSMFERAHAIGEVVVGIENLLKDDGAFVFESHHLLDIIRGGQFDAIYHEHLRTYSLKSLIKLFSYYNFTVTDVEKGFAFRSNIKVHVSKGKNRPQKSSVAHWLELEEEAGLNNAETYKIFAERAKKSKEDFLNFIGKIKAQGKSLGANSCPARCVTLLNYYGVDAGLIPYIAERPASPKLGMYLPGRHIRIVNNEILTKEQPDYVVLLAWYYAEPIIKQSKATGLKSDFIIPLPDFKVVKNSD